METNNTLKTVQVYIGVTLLMLVVLTALFIDTSYLTSSVRVSMVAFGIIGGLLFMNGSVVQQIKVEVKTPHPLRDEQAMNIVKQSHINSYKELLQLESDCDRISREIRRKLVRNDDWEAMERINKYILERLGREQAMIERYGWEEEAESNKRAWDDYEKKVLCLNPITGEKYWFEYNGTPYTISMEDYNKKNEEDKRMMIQDNKVGIQVRG